MNKILFIAGLDFKNTDEDLRKACAQYGNVVSAKVILNRVTGQSRGFGFVEMSSAYEAKEVIARLNDFDYNRNGRKLIVKFRENR